MALCSINSIQSSLARGGAPLVQQINPNPKFTVYTFTQNGTLPITPLYDASISILAIGGGGSGGAFSIGEGGGGGGGGFYVLTRRSIPKGDTLTVTIGDGGPRATAYGQSGVNGSNTTVTFSTNTQYNLTAYGGGGGGGGYGLNGASGGGAGKGSIYFTNGIAITSYSDGLGGKQGNDGGPFTNYPVNDIHMSSGGGGAGTAGKINATYTTTTNAIVNTVVGGNGRSYTMMNGVTYGPYGGGGADGEGSKYGGTGGGGNMYVDLNNKNHNVTGGTPNTGGGGSGGNGSGVGNPSWIYGTAGGSGIVIVVVYQ